MKKFTAKVVFCWNHSAIKIVWREYHIRQPTMLTSQAYGFGGALRLGSHAMGGSLYLFVRMDADGITSDVSDSS